MNLLWQQMHSFNQNNNNKWNKDKLCHITFFFLLIYCTHTHGLQSQVILSSNLTEAIWYSFYHIFFFNGINAVVVVIVVVFPIIHSLWLFAMRKNLFYYNTIVGYNVMLKKTFQIEYFMLLFLSLWEERVMCDS